MGFDSTISNIIEQRLLSLHTCYLAKVLSTDGETAKILPLGKVKAYGEEAKAQSVLTNVPIINSARYKFTPKKITYVTDVIDHGAVKGSQTFALIPREIQAGDIVVCVCGERNITDAKKGINSTPPAGHHSKSDSIIIGIL